LFKHTEERSLEATKLQAKIAGVEFKIQSGEVEKKPLEELKRSFRFGAPEEYDHLSEEEKEELTQHMMGKHKMWKSSKKILGASKPVSH